MADFIFLGSKITVDIAAKKWGCKSVGHDLVTTNKATIEIQVLVCVRVCVCAESLEFFVCLFLVSGNLLTNGAY